MTEIIAYYEEIINDRIEQGEDLKDVLKEYDPKRIKREMLPEMIQKRDHKALKTTSKSSLQLFFLLISTPILIPLAIVYLALIIVLCALTFAGIAVLVTTIIALIPYSYDVFTTTQSLSHQIGLLGIGLVALPSASLIGFAMFKCSLTLMKKMVKYFSHLVTRKQA